MKQKALIVGRILAREVFNQRSPPGRRNVEVHLSEDELAQLIAIGVMFAWERPADSIKDDGG